MNAKSWRVLFAISLFLSACGGTPRSTEIAPATAAEEAVIATPVPAPVTEDAPETEQPEEPTAAPEEPSEAVRVPDENVEGFGTLVDFVEAPLFESADSGFDSLWLPIGDAGYVARVDLETGVTIATIEVGDPQGDIGTFSSADPMSLAVSDEGVWVTNRAGKSLVMIDPTTNEIVREIPIGVYGLNLVADGDLLWVTNPDNATVTRVNMASGEVEAVINLGHPLYITAGAGSVWVAQPSHGKVSRIDPETNEVVAEINLGAVTEDIFFAEGSIWLPLSAPTALVRIDPTTNKVAAQIFFERENRWLWGLASGEGSIWLRVGPEVPECNDTTNFITRIDPATNTEVSRMYLSCARSVYFAGDYLWVQLENEAGDHVIARIRPQS